MFGGRRKKIENEEKEQRRFSKNFRKFSEKIDQRGRKKGEKE